MKNNSFLFSRTAFLMAIVTSPVKADKAFDYQLQIEHPSANWIIKAQSIPLLQREAKLAINEQALAKQLRPLLDKQDYQAALSVINKGQSDQPSPALLQVKGQILFALNRDEQAKLTFRNALEKLPDFVRAHRSLSIIYVKQKQYKQARQHMVKTINLGGGDAQLFGHLAFINLQLSSPWSAISGYQKAMLLQPENKQWKQGLLFSLVSAKNTHAAAALVDEMIEEDPKSIDLWLQRSRIALDSQKPYEALSSMEMALRLGDSSSDNQITTAQLHIKHGSVSRAANIISSILNEWQRNPASFHTDKFNAIESAIAWLVYEQHWPEAKKLISAADQPSQKLTSVQRSKLTVHQARIPGNSQSKVNQLFELAIQLDPTNGDALLALAEHLKSKRELSKAQMLYVRAASLSQFAERAYVGHAQVYVELKNYASAAEKLRQALKLNPARQDLVNNIRVLDRLNSNQI